MKEYEKKIIKDFTKYLEDEFYPRIEEIQIKKEKLELDLKDTLEWLQLEEEFNLFSNAEQESYDAQRASDLSFSEFKAHELLLLNLDVVY